jgi:hypothetical protein
MLASLERRGGILAACDTGTGDAAGDLVTLWVRAAAGAGVSAAAGAGAGAAGAVDAGTTYARSMLAFAALSNPTGNSDEFLEEDVALLEGLAAWWAAPGRAERAADRLAELGLADAPRAVRDLRLALTRMGVAQRWLLTEGAARGGAAATDAAWRALVARCEAMQRLAPEGAVAALWLCKALAQLREPRLMYAAAVRARQRAAVAGRGYVALCFEMAAAEAVHAGALGGGGYTTRQLRPLVESMRLHIERAKEWLPRSEAEATEHAVASYEELIADRDQRVPGARLPAVWRLTPPVPVKPRRCARCGIEAVEMPLCSRCRAARYCSPACQRAHWPEQKAACRQ